MSNSVPAWPIITLRWEGEILVVSDSDASLDMRRVLPMEDEDPFETSRRAAVKACKSLHMDRARVQGIDGDNVLSLIVDARQGTLTPAHAPSGSVATRNRAHTALEDARAKAGGSPFGKIMVPLLGLLAGAAKAVDRMGSRTSGLSTWAKTRKGRRALTVAVVLVCVMATTSVVVAQRAGWFSPSTQSVQAAAPAPAGQLPVYAPAGWQTFASWTVPTDRSSVAPVLSPDGNHVITVNSSHLDALDSRTGALAWSTALEGAMSSLRVMAVDGEQKIVMAEAGKMRVFGLDGTPGPVYEAGNPSAQSVVDLGREAFFTLPDQRAMVLSEGGMSLRRIPAGAVPVGADRGTLLAVEISTAKLWRITDDSVKFPAPQTLPAPKGATKLTAVHTAADGSLISVWAGPEKSDQAIVSVLPVLPKLAAPTVTKTVRAAAVSSTTPVVDRYSGTVLINQVLIDTGKHTVVEVPGSSGKLGAGYWWGTKDQKPVRVSTSGDVVPSPEDTPIPLFPLPEHRVLVQAGADKSIYALEPEGDKK